jgi:Tol biopolymer transport system component
MAANRSLSKFEVTLPNGQDVQVEVEQSRTSSELAEIVARKASLLLQGCRAELCLVSTGETLAGTAKDLATIFTGGNKIALRIVPVASSQSTIQPDVKTSNVMVQNGANPRLAFRVMFLVLLAVLVVAVITGAVLYQLGELPLPVQTEYGIVWKTQRQVRREQRRLVQETEGIGRSDEHMKLATTVRGPLEVRIESVPSGADVEFNGNHVGQTPATVLIQDRGTVSLRMLGYAPIKEGVTRASLTRHSDTKLSFALETQNVVAFSYGRRPRMYLINSDGNCLSALQIPSLHGVQRTIEEEGEDPRLELQVLSPDGRHVAVAGRWESPQEDKGLHKDLFVSSTVGQSWFRLSRDMYLFTIPAWSVDSRSLAFCSAYYTLDNKLATGVFTVEFDGTNRQQVGNDLVQIAYMPDGTLVSELEGEAGFQIIRKDGTKIKEWKPTQGKVGRPIPTPTGDEVFFLAALEDTTGDGEIRPNLSLSSSRGYDALSVYRVRFDDGRVSKILEGGYNIRSVSPDGTRLLVRVGTSRIDSWDLRKNHWDLVFAAARKRGEGVIHCHWVTRASLEYLRQNNKIYPVKDFESE